MHSLLMHCHRALCPQHPFFISFIGLPQSGHNLFPFPIIFLPRRVVLFAPRLAWRSELLARQPSQSSATHISLPTSGLRQGSVDQPANLSQAKSGSNPLARQCQTASWEKPLAWQLLSNGQSSTGIPRATRRIYFV